MRKGMPAGAVPRVVEMLLAYPLGTLRAEDYTEGDWSRFQDAVVREHWPEVVNDAEVARPAPEKATPTPMPTPAGGAPMPPPAGDPFGAGPDPFAAPAPKPAPAPAPAAEPDPFAP